MYTIEDYIAAIRREQEKRRTAYPKMVAKRKKELEAEGCQPSAIDFECLNIVATQKLQFELLEDCLRLITGEKKYHKFPLGQIIAIAGELNRELTMRKKVYSLWVWRKRMTKEVADYEKGVWKALVEFFKETYITQYLKNGLKSRINYEHENQTYTNRREAPEPGLDEVVTLLQVAGA